MNAYTVLRPLRNNSLSSIVRLKSIVAAVVVITYTVVAVVKKNNTFTKQYRIKEETKGIREKVRCARGRH